MPSSTSGSTPGQPSYLRARPNGEVDSRRVARAMFAVCLVLLAAVVVVTTIEAANQNSVQTRLQHDGVPVGVTVTGCIAYSSGIGLHITSYECRGSYVLDGQTHTAIIGGGAFRPVGQAFQGVTTRGDPALLSTSAAAAKKFSRWTPYTTPLVLAAITVALAVCLLVWSRAPKRVGSMRSGVVAD